MFSIQRRIESDALKKECARIEAEKADLEAKLKIVNASLSCVKTRLSLLAPINILPDDVVTEILRVAYQHHFPHCRLDDGLYHTNSPVAFSQVCRRWRHLALCMPSLWTCIHITSSQGPLYEGIVKLYLERSRGRSLSIFFVCYTDLPDEDDHDDSDSELGLEDFVVISWPRYRSTWTLLLSQAHRWKHCALYSATEEIATHLAHSLDGALLPRLESFSHMLNSYHWWPERSIRFFAPNLTRLQLRNLSARYPLVGTFRHLTEFHLSMGKILVRELVRTLELCSQSLQSLTLVYLELPNYNDEEAPTLPASIPLPRLRTLALYSFEEAYYGRQPPARIIELLLRDSPMLHTVAIAGAFPSTVWFPPERFGPLSSVKILRVERVDTFVDLFPAIEELEVYNTHWSKTFTGLPSLYDSPSFVAWPYLRSLSVHGHIPEHELSHFIEYRSEIGSGLRQLRVSATTIGALSQKARNMLDEYCVDVACQEGDSRHEWWSDWDFDRNGPVCSPWSGDLYPWTQF